MVAAWSPVAGSRDMTISNNVKSVRIRENSAGRLSVMRLLRIALRVKRCMRPDFLTLLLLIAFRTGYYTSAKFAKDAWELTKNRSEKFPLS